MAFQIVVPSLNVCVRSLAYTYLHVLFYIRNCILMLTTDKHLTTIDNNMAEMLRWHDELLTLNGFEKKSAQMVLLLSSHATSNIPAKMRWEIKWPKCTQIGRGMIMAKQINNNHNNKLLIVLQIISQAINSYYMEKTVCFGIFYGLGRTWGNVIFICVSERKCQYKSLASVNYHVVNVKCK